MCSLLQVTDYTDYINHPLKSNKWADASSLHVLTGNLGSLGGCFISLNATVNVWMLENPVVFSPVSLLHICWSLFLWMPPIFCHRRFGVERLRQIWLFCLQSCSGSKTHIQHIHTCKPGKENKSKRGKCTGSECVWVSQLRFASWLDNNSRLFSYANLSDIQFLLWRFQPCSLNASCGVSFI